MPSLGRAGEGLTLTAQGLRAKHATLGIYIIRCSNSVGVAVSRRRYPQQDSGQKCIGGYYYTHSANALYQFPVHYPAKGDAPGELVTTVTRARAISHEVTYQLLRGHVTTVTSHQCWPRAMYAGRYRHRYRLMRMGNDSRGRCQPSLRGMQCMDIRSGRALLLFTALPSAYKVGVGYSREPSQGYPTPTSAPHLSMAG